MPLLRHRSLRPFAHGLALFALAFAAAFARASDAHASDPLSPIPVSAPAPASAPTNATGLWIWTRRDLDVLSAARATDTGLRSAVHVANVQRRGAAIAWQRALSPAVEQGGRAGAIVIRIDDSIHGIWAEGDADEVARRLSPVLGEILTQSLSTGATVDEIELDYDAPVRVAASWARVAGTLASGPLRGRTVWVTSIPAHLDAPGFSGALAHAGLGQILQLFDTGLPCTASNYTHLAARLATTHAPFRVGLGAYERTGSEGQHACWALRARGLRSMAGYEGAWIFPAGRDVMELLGALADGEVRP
jgi:hypothetical protein